MRLFFAVALPDDIIAAIVASQAKIRKPAGEDGIRWTRPEQFHYTLKFLGEQPPARMTKATLAAELIRRSVKPFDLVLAGIGAFPNANRPGTIWLGAASGAESLAELAGKLDRALHHAGFALDNRPLTPHLTLARIKSYQGEASAAKALEKLEIGEVGRATVDRFVLMQSNTKPTGSEYTVIQEFKLEEGDERG